MLFSAWLVMLVYIIYVVYTEWDIRHPYLRIVAGTGKGERRRVKSYDGTTITLYSPLKMTADTTYKFIIEK